jgi:hypothetical protein
MNVKERKKESDSGLFKVAFSGGAEKETRRDSG